MSNTEKPIHTNKSTGEENIIEGTTIAQADSLDGMLDAAGQALFRLGRVFSRYPVHQILKERTGRSVEISHILVAQVVAEEQLHPEHETTVGVIAERLAIDPSTASRLVADGVHAGYLTRTASAADGRRIQLVLTDAGQELVEQALRYQRSVFEQLTQTWSEQERSEFARLFIQFAHAITEIYPTAKQTQ